MGHEALIRQLGCPMEGEGCSETSLCLLCSSAILSTLQILILLSFICLPGPLGILGLMTPGFNYARPAELSLCPSPQGVAPAPLAAPVPWVAPPTPPRTPAQVPCYLEPPPSLQTQAGHCPLVQETGPGLPCLLNREGPSPWEEVGARGRKWVAKEQRTCLSSGGRPASSHGRVKTPF